MYNYDSCYSTQCYPIRWIVWDGQHLIFVTSNTIDLFPKILTENIWLPCILYEYYPLRISLDYTLYKIRWKRYPAEKSANQSTLELQPWKTAQFGFFYIGDIFFIYFIILNTDMNFKNEGWFFSFLSPRIMLLEQYNLHALHWNPRAQAI